MLESIKGRQRVKRVKDGVESFINEEKQQSADDLRTGATFYAEMKWNPKMRRRQCAYSALPDFSAALDHQASSKSDGLQRIRICPIYRPLLI